MKIVQTYLPTKNGVDVNKPYFYTIILSVLLAKKYYGKIVLYTNEEFADIVNKIGLPYDEIDTNLLKDVECDTFSIPKLLVYKAQDEPFIHIDLDTLLFKIFHLNDIDSIYCSFGENYEKINDNDGNDFYHTYIEPVMKIKDKLSPEFIPHISFKDVPNMSFFGTLNTKLLNDAIDYCLKIYEENKDFFDENFYHACVIEQLFIPSAMKMIKTRDKDPKDLQIHFLCEKPPAIIFEKDRFDYPFIISHKDDRMYFQSKWDLFKYVLHDFNGFMHLGGFKKFEKLAFLIKQRIMLDFDGYEYIRNLNKIYKEKIECDELSSDYYDYLNHISRQLFEYKFYKQKLL